MAPEHDDQGFAEQLFEAARRERPSELVKQRALRDALRPPRARRPWRWLLIAAAVGAVVTLLVREHDARQPLAAVSAEPSHSSPKPAEAPASVVPQPPLPTPSPSALATVARSAAPKPQPATLEAELALVDHARQALLDRNYDDALATLAQYD
ncbi:MAG TPA: hypothetical protein VEQ58_07480, partial [Polyangiaceae bacterium]|nr:hypothetical protein [Polyangiaceae bacterium]